jgi:hypothetical protein
MRATARIALIEFPDRGFLLISEPVKIITKHLVVAVLHYMFRPNGHLQVYMLFYFYIPEKLHADGNIISKTYWTNQCSRMLKYSIITKAYYQVQKVHKSASYLHRNSQFFETHLKLCLFSYLRENINASMKKKMDQAIVVVTLLHFVRRSLRMSAVTPATSTLADVFDGLPQSLWRYAESVLRFGYYRCLPKMPEYFVTCMSNYGRGLDWELQFLDI